MAKPLTLRTDSELETREEIVAKIQSIARRKAKLVESNARDWRKRDEEIRRLYERDLALCAKLEKLDRESGIRPTSGTDIEASPARKTDWAAYGLAMEPGEVLSIHADIAEAIVDRLMESGCEFRIQPLRGRVLVLKCPSNSNL